MSLIIEDAHVAKSVKAWIRQIVREERDKSKAKLLDSIEEMFTDLMDNVNNLYDANEEKVKAWRKQKGGY